MKKIIVATTSIICIVLTSCSSITNYSKSEFNKNKLNNKTIIFYMNPINDSIDIEKKGLIISIPIPGKPIYNRDIFKKSVIDLANETQVNLKYSDTLKTSNDSIIYIKTDLINNTFRATFFHGTMLSSINYNFKDSEVYNIKGRYRNYYGGLMKKFLYKSYKNANYQLVKKLTDSLMVN